MVLYYTFLYYKSKPFQGSDSTLLGTAIHNYFQGNRHLVAFNNILRTSKERKLEYIEFEKTFKEMAGEEGIIVPKSFEEKINAVMLNYNENKQAIDLMNECVFEEPFLFEYNGVQLKGKLDANKTEKSSVVEIKTSSMATNAYEFKREAYDRDYDLQAFLYLKASGNKKHYFIVANTTAPFKVTVYKSSEEFLESGKHKADLVTNRYKKHIVNGEPFDDSENVEEI